MRQVDFRRGNMRHKYFPSVPLFGSVAISVVVVVVVFVVVVVVVIFIDIFFIEL